jgi:hypothetical protein
MTQPERKRVETSRTALTYAYNYHVAREALDHAEAAEEGQVYNVMAAMTFCAFTLESYLNHVGMMRVPNWENIELVINPKEKCKVVADALRATIENSRRPFQTFHKIFVFRNQIVHGKTFIKEEIKELFMLPGDRPELPGAYWETLCKFADAQRFVTDTEQMIIELHRHVDPDEHPLGTLATGGWSASEP